MKELRDEDIVPEEVINELFPIKELTELLEKHGFKMSGRPIGLYVPDENEAFAGIKIVCGNPRRPGVSIVASFSDSLGQ